MEIHAGSYLPDGLRDAKGRMDGNENTLVEEEEGTADEGNLDGGTVQPDYSGEKVSADEGTRDSRVPGEDMARRVPNKGFVVGSGAEGCLVVYVADGSQVG
jgi:hypothetical protein